MLQDLDANWDGFMHTESQESALYLEFNNHFFSALLQKQITSEKLRRSLLEGFYVNNFMVKFFEQLLSEPESYLKEIC